MYPTTISLSVASLLRFLCGLDCLVGHTCEGQRFAFRLTPSSPHTDKLCELQNRFPSLFTPNFLASRQNRLSS